MILEARPRRGIRPTKNKTGVDSVESCKAMQVERERPAASNASGVKVRRNAEGITNPPSNFHPDSSPTNADAALICREQPHRRPSAKARAVYIG